MQQRLMADYKFPSNQVALDSFDEAMEAIAEAKGDPKKLSEQDAALRNIAIDFVSRRDVYARFIYDYTQKVGDPKMHILIAGQPTAADLKPSDGYIWQYMMLRPPSEHSLAYAESNALVNVAKSNGPGTIPILRLAMDLRTSSDKGPDYVAGEELGILKALRLICTSESLNAMCECVAHMQAQWQEHGFDRDKTGTAPVPYVVELLHPINQTLSTNWRQVIESDSGEGLSAEAREVLRQIKAGPIAKHSGG